MQSLRRIPACAQVRVLFLNRSYAASTSSTDALVRLNAISRMNSRSILRFDDRNLVQVAFLSLRGLQTAVQNSGRKTQETSSTNILSSFFNFEKFCDKNLKGVDKEKLSEDEMKEIKDYLRVAFLAFVALQLLFVLSMAQTYWIWSNETKVKNKVGKQYASYLSSESIPFDDSIEELLKSGKVTQIIHLVHFQKAVAVLNPGLVIDIDDVSVGQEAVVLNLENSAWKVRSSAPGFAQEVRRIEKQIGIESSNEVPIKVEGEQQIWFTWILFTIFLAGGLIFKRNVGKAKDIVRKKFLGLKTV
ncbi:hypothetical protein DdX_15143 [Ditylenchus destructor]|uniref:Uncharacterized protein n=1 Tax=Ditylenchus destructor TaxID=166010 RepID=A0AAD4MQV6_9BILA|nr:hypothetical protein DdX_15143 [Ditylenchus destructor]